MIWYLVGGLLFGPPCREPSG